MIEEFEKLSFLPDLNKKTIEKVLISATGPTQALLDRSYFDRVITLEDIFSC